MKYLPQVISARYVKDFVVHTVFDKALKKKRISQNGLGGRCLSLCGTSGTSRDF
jgi:hypothetical protein